MVAGEGQASDELDQPKEIHEHQRLCDLSREARGRIAGDEGTSEGVDDGVHIEVEDGEGFDLVVETRDEAELSFGATVCLFHVSLMYLPNVVALTNLRFVESGLINLLLESFGNFLALKEAVLAEKQPVFEGEFREREAYY